MHCGTFVGINRNRQVVGPNEDPMLMEEFMMHHGIDEPSKVLGDFETTLSDRYELEVRGWSHEKLHQEALKMARETRDRLRRDPRYR